MGLILPLSYACINASPQTNPARKTLYDSFLYIKHLVIGLLDFLNDLSLIVILKATSWDFIQS